MFGQIRWRIALPYMGLIALAMTGLAVYLSGLVREAYLNDLRAKLVSEARLMADALAPSFSEAAQEEYLDQLAQHYADLMAARVTIIGIDGAVLGESHGAREEMQDHLFRPEVQQALAAGEGSSIRFSETLGYEMMYAAVPIYSEEGEVTCIARVSVPLDAVEANVTRLRGAILAAALLATFLAALLALFIAERTACPIRELTEVAEHMADGDLSARGLPTRGEIGVLTDAFNRMARELEEKVATLTREQSRLAGVLTTMADGAIITSEHGQVLLINPAAARLLGATEEAAMGRSLVQVVRQHELAALWQRCRETGEEQVATIETGRRTPLFLRAIATRVRGEGPSAILIILQDLTQIRRLETVRRDFISNISHELRTPLASLKALADTLRDGALEDPPAARHFLDNIEAEVDALTQMVEELMALSQLESGQAPLELLPVAVADILLPPVERLRLQAERAGLTLTVGLPPDIPPVLADLERIRQVVTNLVHNAIKFTPAGGEITLSAAAAAGEVIISVHDTGIGIPADDLPRIFERFYKADRARSGGGTGLGLSIAKHIVLAHNGRIWAESLEGQGSTFYFSLPPVR
jgi:two-component system phosphate regulon sensor histidine kinase PhoR